MRNAPFQNATIKRIHLYPRWLESLQDEDDDFDISDSKDVSHVSVSYNYNEKEVDKEVFFEPVAYGHVKDATHLTLYLNHDVDDAKNFAIEPLYGQDTLSLSKEEVSLTSIGRRKAYLSVLTLTVVMLSVLLFLANRLNFDGGLVWQTRVKIENLDACSPSTLAGVCRDDWAVHLNHQNCCRKSPLDKGAAQKMLCRRSRGRVLS